MPRNDFVDEERPYGKRSSQKYSKNWQEDECPYFEEHRPCRDHRDCREKCFCPEWLMCPPPWFWCKPEEEKKECKKEKDECDCHKKDKDECDCRKKEKECCGELEAYGYIYSLSATAVTVAPNNDIVFTNNGPLDCITHTPNTAQIFIRKSGVYQVFYSVNTTVGVGGSISLAVNGTVDPATTIPIQIAASNTAGKAILNLRAGDILTLRNSSTVAITLAIAPAVGAQLTLERIDEIEKCNNF